MKDYGYESNSRNYLKNSGPFTTSPGKCLIKVNEERSWPAPSRNSFVRRKYPLRELTDRKVAISVKKMWSMSN